MKAKPSHADKSHAAEIPFEYNQITKYIYIGTNQCCTDHFNRSLVRKGIRADISLEDKRLDRPWGVKYFLWLPTKNYTPPSLEQLRIGVGFLHEMVANKVKVYVHCEHGHGRAPTLVAAYFISLGKTVDQAIQAIEEKRKVTHLDRSQINALRRYQRSIKRWRGLSPPKR